LFSGMCLIPPLRRQFIVGTQTVGPEAGDVTVVNFEPSVVTDTATRSRTSAAVQS
jgi:hypothetical protein